MLKLWILHGCVEIGNLSVAKYFTSECSKRVKYFATKGVTFIQTPMKCQNISCYFFAAKGAIHCATVTSVIF